jgi:aerobic carbon-monoxide dehydrogenase small subunit
VEPTTTKILTLRVNGRDLVMEVGAHETLVKVLQEKIGLTGTKIGCESGECGACTVLIDGTPILSCLTLAIECEGKNIVTIEGLTESGTGELHPVQEAFINNFGFQCGYCTPGFIMTAKALLDRKGDGVLTEEEIRDAIAGNICRCGDYMSIIQSIKEAAKRMGKQCL